MGVYNDVKKVLFTTVDAIVDKTTTQAQKSRLVTVMKNEEKIANQAYLQLGKYLYQNLRQDMPEEIEELCKRLDESKERMSRAQQSYRDVIRQELVNREISRSEVKENLNKIKEPLVTKAKDTATMVKDTAIDTAAKVKETAKDTAVKVGEATEAAAEKIADIKAEALNDKPDTEEILERIEELNGAEELADPIVQEDELNDTVKDVLTVGQGLNDNVQVIENAIFSDSSLGEDSVAPQTDEPHEIFSFSKQDNEESANANEAANEAEDITESLVPDSDVIDQEFQRNVPVDIISENEFEQDQPEVKSASTKNTPFTKAMKLKNIITKKGNDEE